MNDASKDEIKNDQAQFAYVAAAVATVDAGNTGNVDLDAMEAEIDGLRYQKRENPTKNVMRGRKPSENIQLDNSKNPQVRKRSKKHKTKADSPATQNTLNQFQMPSLAATEDQMKKDPKKKREKRER